MALRRSDRSNKGSGNLKEIWNGTEEDLDAISISSENKEESSETEDFKENHRYPTRSSEPREKRKRIIVQSDSDSEDGAESINLRRSSRNTNKAPKTYTEDDSNINPVEVVSDGQSSEEEILPKKKIRRFGEEKVDVEFVPEQESESDGGSNSRSKFSRGKTKLKIRHEKWCKECRDGGELLCCDTCPLVYHLECLDPPLETVPSGKWKCPFCAAKPLEKVGRILTWRWKTKTLREFFVYYEGKSYWRCEWVSETRLQVWQPILLRCYYMKFGKKEPPELYEGDARRLRKNSQDPLEKRFYQNGVRPEWLRIHRIVDHFEEDDGSVSYLVKWQNLGYDVLTWEDEETMGETDIAEEYRVAIETYQEWRSYWSESSKKREFNHVFVPPKKPVSDLRQKLEVQPEFIREGLNLHEYQLEGLNWLRYSWANGVNTILADEMGLGKTIQTIVFLRCLYREGHCQGPFLISAPLSTISNWEREFELWAPELYVVTYMGDKETRLKIRQTEFVEDSSKIGKALRRVKSPVKFHVLLTSYQFPSMDSTCLASIPWKMMVVDEGHRLKDENSLFFTDLMLYKTSYKLLLTGTPLQNTLQELFTLLNFLCPEKFSDADAFLEEFEDIAKEDQIQKLHEQLGPHLLRRLKADVLKNMPAKSELIVRVELSSMQKRFSKYILTKNAQALNAKVGKQTSLKNILMDLRKVCNHPYLFSKAAEEAPEDPSSGNYELEALTDASGKLVMLRRMLSVLKVQGHRVLIFSQFTTMLDLLEEFLEELGYGYERIDGDVTGSMRQDRIDRFNAEGAEQFVFLLSTRAGGLGINLASADTVIIYDSDWNPHNDIQAFSRAHRIGQKNKVMIYRFITRRSVEEKIAQVCKQKMMLTHLVVRPEMGEGVFSKKELEDIIRFGTEELFKDQTDAPVRYTDAAIEDLLDRNKEDAEVRKNDFVNDYFSSFKVASYGVAHLDDPETDSPNLDDSGQDQDHWKTLLMNEINQEEDLNNFGKGKRKRNEVQYSQFFSKPNALSQEDRSPRQSKKMEKAKSVEKEAGNSDSDISAVFEESSDEYDSGDDYDYKDNKERRIPKPNKFKPMNSNDILNKSKPANSSGTSKKFKPLTSHEILTLIQNRDYEPVDQNVLPSQSEVNVNGVEIFPEANDNQDYDWTSPDCDCEECVGPISEHVDPLGDNA